eukprot:snap_masked-scaffold_39-processed-gene-2.70-mRNA-1 protein AED:1.00 eAED:1.00 QI:0/-1/0/0/-1/1/1/0/316
MKIERGLELIKFLQICHGEFVRRFKTRSQSQGLPFPVTSFENWEESLRRYEDLWLPLVEKVKKTEMCNLNELKPPVDIAWIWFAHKLRPKEYLKTLRKVKGKKKQRPEKVLSDFQPDGGFEVLGVSLDNDDESKTKTVWKNFYPNEQFFLSQPATARPPVLLENKNMELRCFADHLRLLLWTALTKPLINRKASLQKFNFDLISMIQERKEFTWDCCFNPLTANQIWKKNKMFHKFEFSKNGRESSVVLPLCGMPPASFWLTEEIDEREVENFLEESREDAGLKASISFSSPFLGLIEKRNTIKDRVKDTLMKVFS